MLTHDDHSILRFEDELGALPRWRKVSAIQRDLKISEVRYYQRLLALAERQDALAEYPQAIYRARAIIEKRTAHKREALVPRPEMEKNVR